MATMNGVPFRKKLVSKSKYSIKCPYPMTPKKITYHNTDNEMPAANEISYMRNNNNQTSFHIAVDEKEAIQGIPYNRNAWAAGDGKNGYGNRNTIHMEICRNYDRKRLTTRLIDPLAGMYGKAESNAIKVGAQLHKDLDIPATVNTVKKHQDWSGKNCPSKILNESRWNAFQVAVIVEYNRLVGKPLVASARVHVVTKGDTLSAIAKKHNTTVAALVKENGIRNPNILSIGQKVTIPTGKSDVVKPSATAHRPNQLKVDGYWGPATTRRLQEYFGTPVDGVISGQPDNASVRNIPSARIGNGGSLLIREMQKFAGTTADGRISEPSQLIRALQKRFGTTQDGKINKPSQMVREMQRRLNWNKL